VFEATLDGSGERVVVKLSPIAACVAAHQLLAEHGLAPKLLAHSGPNEQKPWCALPGTTAARP
jgi:hypothetical protein